MNNKIGILTQPLGHNYGGILQAYALQEVLRRMGHTVETIDFQKESSHWRRVASVVKRVLLHRPLELPIRQKDRKAFYAHTKHFIRQHIALSPKLASETAVKEYCDKQNYDALIVGSDQVWREVYSPHLPTFFLDFLPANSTTRRIAYAASYGSRDPISPEMVMRVKPFARRFDAISVRERSGIELTKKLFDVGATEVLDPTMLLSADDYKALFAPLSDDLPGNMFVYVLDRTEEKDRIIRQEAEKRGLSPFELLPQGRRLPEELFKSQREPFELPPVELWLKSIAESDFVVTDSFHGTVFSILFRKPFLAIINQVRGADRFYALQWAMEPVTEKDLSESLQVLRSKENRMAIPESLIAESLQFLERALS